MIIEYPKSLYMNGDQEAEHIIVHDEKTEKSVRELGFCMMGESPEKAKRTRKVKNDNSTSDN